MRDLAAVTAFRFPVAVCQAQVAAGRVLAVALFGGPGGLHVAGDGAAVCLPGHGHATRVEVADETHQGGLVGAELLLGGREQGDRGWWSLKVDPPSSYVPVSWVTPGSFEYSHLMSQASQNRDKSCVSCPVNIPGPREY